MKIHLIAVGTKMPAWVQQGYNEYAKRLPRDMAPNLVELTLGARGKNSNIDVAKKNEGQAMMTAIESLPGDNRIVALDVVGKSLSTEGLANKMENCQMQGQNICLLIGGPDGLAPECLQRADEKWSLSALTLPHPLVRVVLIEQLYRAWTILQNHPYHK